MIVSNRKVVLLMVLVGILLLILTFSFSTEILSLFGRTTTSRGETPEPRNSHSIGASQVDRPVNEGGGGANSSTQHCQQEAIAFDRKKIPISIFFTPETSVAITSLSVLNEDGDIEYQCPWIEIAKHNDEGEEEPIRCDLQPGRKLFVFIDEYGFPDYQFVSALEPGVVRITRKKKDKRERLVSVRDIEGNEIHEITATCEIRVPRDPELGKIWKQENESEVIAFIELGAGVESPSGGASKMFTEHRSLSRGGIFKIVINAQPAYFWLIMPIDTCEACNLILTFKGREYTFRVGLETSRPSSDDEWIPPKPTVLTIPVIANQADKDASNQKPPFPEWLYDRYIKLYDITNLTEIEKPENEYQIIHCLDSFIQDTKYASLARELRNAAIAIAQTIDEMKKIRANTANRDKLPVSYYEKWLDLRTLITKSFRSIRDLSMKQ